MIYLVKPIKKSETDIITMATNFVSKIFALYTAFLSSKVSNDLDKYFQRYSIVKDILEPDVHDMKSHHYRFYQF